MMDLETIKQYYEKNIRKGYTIEQINNNLLQNHYSPILLKQVVELLEHETVMLSQTNPKKFDYSKLPLAIRKLIEKPIEDINSQNGKSNPEPKKPIAKPEELPIVEMHPGLDQKSLIGYIGAIAIIVIIIIITAVLLSKDDGIELNKNIEDIYNNLDTSDGVDETVEERESGLEEVKEIEETIPEDTPEIINETQNNETDIEPDKIEDTIKPSRPEGESFDIKVTSDIVCTKDTDCDDNYPLSNDRCDNSKCRHKSAEPEEYCGISDGFCKTECYAFNDTDCVNEDGTKTCLEDSHCDDGIETTQDFCVVDETYCHHNEIETPNHPPKIYSEYNDSALELQEYTYQILVNDTDNDEIIYNLKDEPDDMIIDGNGTLTWTPPSESAGKYTFTVEASDEEDEDEQEIKITVFMTEESDEIRQACGDSASCYKDSMIVRQDFNGCGYLGVYWDDSDHAFEDSCIFEIVKITKNKEQCENIIDVALKSICNGVQ